jgi:hypothetical protein
MNPDHCAEVAARLGVLLRDPESYKEFLACRETDAQGLLDVLQDVSTSNSNPIQILVPTAQQLLDLDSFSDHKPLIFKALLRLSRASGLHPRCFALHGLQKGGQQVAAGGFGDIWKGSVRGQIVAVKVMRFFGGSDVEAAKLKVYCYKLPLFR